jgi:hypothetical protein
MYGTADITGDSKKMKKNDVTGSPTPHPVERSARLQINMRVAERDGVLLPLFDKLVRDHKKAMNAARARGVPVVSYFAALYDLVRLGSVVDAAKAEDDTDEAVRNGGSRR